MMHVHQYLAVLERIVRAKDYANALVFMAKNRATIGEQVTADERDTERALMNRIAHPPSSEIWLLYDIQPFGHYPGAFVDGEPVSMTEKLHGTCCVAGIVGGAHVVTTKRLGSEGIVLREEDDTRYWPAVRRERLHEKLAAYCAASGVTDVLLFGEIFGPGFQDLGYGMPAGDYGYRAFDCDIRVVQPENGPPHIPFAFLDVDTFMEMARAFAIPTVPEVYRGPFSQEALAMHTSGTSTLADQMREGVVVKPLIGRTVKDLGRLVLKSVSPEYRDRIGGTEYQ